jgi:hypothetical protein
MKNDILKLIAQKAKRRLVGKEEHFSNAKIKIIHEDEDFKSKVESLLLMDDVVTNPVQYLLDDNVFKNMNDSQKERYLLSTLDRYNALRRQIGTLHSLNQKVM